MNTARSIRAAARHPLLSVGAVLLASLLPLGCGPSKEPPPKRPDVVIYLVDTLRPDHLGIYGYEKGTSPNLDAFAREAVVFDNAYTPASWTKPATASLLTGLLPYKHGAVTLTNKIPSDVKLLPEYLAPLHYTTAAFVANANVIGVWGFDQGYGHFDDVKKRTGSNDAEAVVSAALRFLEKKPVRPLFLYLHTVDPHGPYDPPQPYKARFTKGIKGRILMPRDLSAETKPGSLEKTRAAYDGEIAYNDAWFGRMLQGLKDAGIYDDAIIVFTADHGEEHGEHGGGGHSRTLFQEVVRIPLVVRFPAGRYAGRRVKVPVTLMDVVPTVLRRADTEAPAVLDGRDLEPLAAGAPPEEMESRPLFFDLDTQRWDGSVNIVQGVLSGRYKLLERKYPENRILLFDLGRDPGERHDLYAAEPDRAAKLHALLVRNRLTAERGVFFRVVNAPGKAVRVFEGVLVTEGRFTGLTRSQLEKEDTLALKEGARRIAFRFTARNYPNPTRKVPPVITDEDAFSFRLDPPDARFTVVRFEDGDGKAAPLFLGEERRPAGRPPLTFAPDAPEILALDPSTVRRTSEESVSGLPAGGYLVSVPGSVREEGVLDPEIRERLRALGYIK